MSTVNKATVYADLLRLRTAFSLRDKLDKRRVRSFRSGNRVGFTVPTGMTVQEAILLLSRLAPEGTEIFAS